MHMQAVGVISASSGRVSAGLHMALQQLGSLHAALGKGGGCMQQKRGDGVGVAETKEINRVLVGLV